MFTMIMPMFRDLAGDTEMPPLSAAIFGISDFMINQGYILVIVLIAIIIVLRLIIKTPSSKLKWDEMLLKLPKVGGLLRTIYTARFARTMSNLFSSGLQTVSYTHLDVYKRQVLLSHCRCVSVLRAYSSCRFLLRLFPQFQQHA